MTLQQCKDQIARENGWENWQAISLSKEAEGILWTMAAELYAAQFKNLVYRDIPTDPPEYLSDNEHLCK